MDTFLSFIVAAVLAAAPLLFGTLGEILTEKSGHLNLGVEGMMFMGGVAGIAGTYYYEKAVGEPNALAAAIIGVLCAFLCLLAVYGLSFLQGFRPGRYELDSRRGKSGRSGRFSGGSFAAA